MAINSLKAVQPTNYTTTSAVSTSYSSNFSSTSTLGLSSYEISSQGNHRGTITRNSDNRTITKANSVTSPFAKFQHLERQNSLPSSGSATLKSTDLKLCRSASGIKDRLLNWVRAQTREYKNIQIDNFSTSWSNGLAFCALIHHFYPYAFDYQQLTPQQRRYNFELAFKVAEQEAGIVPLLDVDDMVSMRKPDWKCVFTYVQTIYQKFHSSPLANHL